MGVTHRSKKFASIPIMLALGMGGLGGCDTDPGASVARDVQRDVYASREQCMLDWGPDLCKELQAEQAKQVAQAQGQQTTGATHGSSFIYWGGPGYVGERSANTGGRTVTPNATNAIKTASFSPTTGKLSGLHAPSVRGGFGATGHSIGSTGAA